MINNLLNNFVNYSQKDNYERISDNLYKFNVTLDNGESAVNIKFSAIEELNIVDDLRFFYVYGTLTINYNNDILESFESLGSKKVTAPYQFRGDGRDLLILDIMPQIKEQKCLQVYASENEKKIFNIKHTCIVYKYEDITSGKGQKQRKFYFWDIDYQLLKELNLNYSTSDKNKNTKNTVSQNESQVPVSNSNTDMSSFTHEILEDILKKSLVETYGLRFNKGQWDTGSTKILYFSDSKKRAIDDLDYVLSLHASSSQNSNLPCILKKERYTDNYNLIPINKFYTSGPIFSLNIFGRSSSPGSNTIEDFYIGKIDSTSSGIGRSTRHSTKNGNGTLNLNNFNLIDDYTFVRIDAKDNLESLSPRIVHGDDPRGFFVADIKSNNNQTLENTYNNTFVKSSQSGSSNLTQNRNKKQNKTVFHVYVPENLSESERKNKGINKNMLQLFFKNTSITFRVRGNTFRKTGNQFSINRTDGNVSGTYDNNVLGKYITTYVRHEFKLGCYYNTIHGVKPYNDKTPNFVETI